MNFHYDFGKPCKTYQLARELREISGIQAVNNASLFCVEDENLNIYEFDPARGKIVAEYGKGAEGDAEDLVVMGKTAYILLAGKRAVTIYNDFQKTMADPHKVKLNLEKEYDPEGMCYCAANGCLLIACKGDPETKSTTRKIFAFDLQNNTLLEKPFFIIDAKKLKTYKKGKTFNPSGIAIHPITQEIYLLGSKSLKLIVRLDATGQKILGESKLKGKLYKQPEGIDFFKNGDLILASEAKKNGKAKIFKLSGEKVIQ